jgi:hypothetical protein
MSQNLLAAGMRAVAGLIEQAGVAEVVVVCDQAEITVQVAQRAGDARARAGLVARLAAVLDATPAVDDAPASAGAWVRARGTAAGLPVRVHTEIAVRRSGAGVPLARTPRGQITAWEHPVRLPPGWRWVTELDLEPAAAGTAPGQAVA